jgi:hypothetical protein
LLPPKAVTTLLGGARGGGVIIADKLAPAEAAANKSDTSKYLVFRGLGERGDVLLRM